MSINISGISTRSGRERDFTEAMQPFRAIITFHSIDESRSVLSYPARSFASLLAALERSRIPVVDLDTLLQPETSCGVALTFDDGIRSVFTAALPILRDSTAPSHLFLTTGAVGGTNRWAGQPAGAPTFDMLRWPEIEALRELGMHIEAHTASHPDLCRLDAAAVAEEYDSANEIIERRLGRRPRFFAYPYGYSNLRVRELARCRYRACLTTELRPLRCEEDMAALPRLDSYYLRSGWIYENLRAPQSRLSVGLRGILRRWRGRS
jgi:peptidoglycan/xylan/chitin deacetylase (PgdA/CDA1 family)